MITMAFGGVAELHIYPQCQRPKKLGLYLLNGRQDATTNVNLQYFNGKIGEEKVNACYRRGRTNWRFVDQGKTWNKRMAQKNERESCTATKRDR